MTTNTNLESFSIENRGSVITVTWLKFVVHLIRNGEKTAERTSGGSAARCTYVNFHLGYEMVDAYLSAPTCTPIRVSVYLPTVEESSACVSTAVRMRANTM